MAKRKVIIDTDCGSDDAMAIAMALKEENVEILLFSCVAGNVEMGRALINTLATLEMTDTYYPPVYRGCESPLVQEWIGAKETHGEDGMGDIGLSHTSLKASDGRAVEKIAEALRDSEKNSIEILTLGPLTNIAMAMRLYPEEMKRVKSITVMGSAGLGYGNVTMSAEYNIYQDPEAADIVFRFGVPVILVGWDACLEEAMLEEEEIEEIRRSSDLGRFCIDSNRVLMSLNRERFGRDCLDMADPAVAAAFLYPECIEKEGDFYAEVDLSHGPSYGNVLIDVPHFTGMKENIHLVWKLKPDLFKRYLIQKLR